MTHSREIYLRTMLHWDESDMLKAKQEPRTPARAFKLFQMRKDIDRTKRRLEKREGR